MRLIMDKRVVYSITEHIMLVNTYISEYLLIPFMQYMICPDRCCSFFNNFVPVVVMTHYRSTHCQRVRSPTNVCYLNHILATASNFMFVFWFNLLIFPLICNLHKLAIWYKTGLTAGPVWCSKLHRQHQLQ